MRHFYLAAASALAVAAITAPLHAQSRTVESQSGPIDVEELASGLDHPWGMAFLPDGRLLVTERAGPLRILSTDNTLSDPVEGTPEVFAQGQGGLLDVKLDPDFENNSLIYLSFAEPGEGGASTAVGRGRFENDSITDFEVLFSQQPKIDDDKHFGGRIIFSQDGKLFLTMGERFQFEPAQNLANHLGTLARINPDGSIPDDNPFSGQDDAEDVIWTYGHRNVEAAAVNPATGDLWVAEMGPQGGDELNLIKAESNYGWPVVSWGEHYDGRDIPDPTTRPEFADAAIHWTPVISPSGMRFYEGDMFADWQGSALIGGLTSQGLVRVTFDGETASEAERIDLGARVRDVEEGPDGSIYVLTDSDNGQIWRLTRSGD